MTTRRRNTNPSQVAPCNGVIMCGETGLQTTGAKEWFKIPNAERITLQFLFNGVLAGDAAVKVEGCLEGGESVPETITTVNAASGVIHYHIVDKIFDKIRINCTTLIAAGKGSNVLVSAR